MAYTSGVYGIQDFIFMGIGEGLGSLTQKIILEAFLTPLVVSKFIYFPVSSDFDEYKA